MMRPGNRDRRIVPLPAGIAWKATLDHRVYSCPVSYDHVFGATCLLLKNGATGYRVILNVEAVETCNPRVPDFSGLVTDKFRKRLLDYVNAVQDLPNILDAEGSY